jgi:glucose/arabinose dehydrogenase
VTAEFTRRRFLGTALAGASAGLAGCGANLTDDPESTTPGSPDDPVPDAVELETLVDGLQSTVDVAFVPGKDRRYVANQQGRIHVHDADGLREEPLLDLGDDIIVFNEQGLLGIELHPEFQDNRRLFVRYSSPPREGTPENYTHTFVLSEFTVSEDGTRAPRESETPILEIPQPHRVHNSGDLTFGPDGYLYVPTGDGGQNSDVGRGHVEDWYDRNGGGNGQDVTENLLGSILRIDVDREQRIRGEERRYGVPDDNPLVGEEGLDEQFAWGFRNPWRTSFDGETYFVGDVGQNLMEEVNVVEKGGNYGWNVREGTRCFNTRNMNDPFGSCPDSTPGSVRGGERLRDPIIEYPNEAPTDGTINGLAVVGGYVYRGSNVPGLEGRYVFGDFQANGRLFVGIPPRSGGGQWSTTVLDIAGSGADRIVPLRSFGRDEDGELYAVGGSGVHRIRSS